ncbi:MAG: GTPase, partial [Nanoarchaeota archaeon]
PFYVQLLQLTLDFPEFKKSFGALTWAIGKISFFHRQYVSKLNRESDRFRVGVISREYYGRISSVLKQIESNLKYLEESRRIMKTYPDVKEMFTVCVYGFPNVGKTTLLNKLTGTKAAVANYSFTTVTINAGYFKMNGTDIQVLDVPGTLDRPEKMNLIEKQAELVLQELADVIVFVFDLSDHCGYSVNEQEKLLETVGKSKKVLVYVSKQDLTEKKVLDGFKHKHYSVGELKKEISGLL